MRGKRRTKRKETITYNTFEGRSIKQKWINSNIGRKSEYHQTIFSKQKFDYD